MPEAARRQWSRSIPCRHGRTHPGSIRPAGEGHLDDRLRAAERELAIEGRLGALLTPPLDPSDPGPRTTPPARRIAAGVATVVYEATGLATTLGDSSGRVLARAGADASAKSHSDSPTARAQLLSTARRHPGPLRHGDRWITAAVVDATLVGVLVVDDPHHDATEHTLRVVERATAIWTIDLAHRQRVAHAEQRLGRALVDDVLAGVDPGHCDDRARALGHDLRHAHHVLVVATRTAAAEPADHSAVERALRRAAAHLDLPCLTTLHQDKVVALVHRPEDAPVGAAHERSATDAGWARLHDLLAGALPRTICSIGVGRHRDAPHLAESHLEARRALDVRCRSADPHGLSTYDSLGVARLLLAGPESRRETELFVRDWLGPLIDYDAARHGELVPTLREFLDAGRHYDTAARAVLIHRSTLRYRLQRIQEISGHDLSNPDTRLHLHLATRAQLLISRAG